MGDRQSGPPRTAHVGDGELEKFGVPLPPEMPVFDKTMKLCNALIRR